MPSVTMKTSKFRVNLLKQRRDVFLALVVEKGEYISQILIIIDLSEFFWTGNHNYRQIYIKGPIKHGRL